MSTNLTSEALVSKVIEAAKLLEAVPQVQECAAGLSGEKVMTVEAYSVTLIWDRLSQLGIYQDDVSHELLVSDSTKEGTARKYFCEDGDPKIPEARFAAIWAILKGKEGREETPKTAMDKVAEAIQAQRPIGQWSDKELLEAYNPVCDTSIVDALDKRAKGAAFIIFQNEQEGIVDVGASLSMLKYARRGKPPVHYKVGDCLKRLYKAGHFPSLVLFRCPFHPDVILIDGYCDECGHVWDISNYEVLQFARLVEQAGEVPNGAYLRQFINDARQYGIQGLKEDYPKVALRFEELKSEDNLPSLKLRTSVDESGSSDPMRPGSRRY